MFFYIGDNGGISNAKSCNGCGMCNCVAHVCSRRCAYAAKSYLLKELDHDEYDTLRNTTGRLGSDQPLT